MRRRDEAGLAAPAVVTLAGLITVLAFLCAVGGRLLVEHRRAAAGADLAALAAATALQHGQPACAAAERFARLNDTTLERCLVRDEVVDVTVVVEPPVLLGRHVRLTGSARAGPVPP